MNIKIIKPISKQSFSYKIIKDGKTVSKCLTHSRRSFSQKIRTINWKEIKEKGELVYLRVNYGKLLDNFGKYSEFHNDGVYTDKESFYLALNAFLED
jgi:hypothetical protein